MSDGEVLVWFIWAPTLIPLSALIPGALEALGVPLPATRKGPRSGLVWGGGGGGGLP